jgi:predicted HTH domain antitoxin
MTRLQSRRVNADLWMLDGVESHRAEEGAGEADRSLTSWREIMGTVKLTLEVPAEVMDAVRLPPSEVEGELRKELAAALYHRGVLSLGKARVLAQMSRWAFEDLLGARGIPRHYSEEDLQEDIEYAHGDQ